MRTLPDALRPRTRAEGYAVQACLERRRSATRFGWKVAATSSAGQAHIGVDGPIAGRLFAERVVRSGTMLPFGSNAMRVAEAEFAFRMARPLTPRAKAYTPEEVLQAVGTLHPAIELPDSRYDDFAAVGGPSLIADVACAHWFVLGEATSTAWRTLDLARATVVVSKAGTSVEGSGAEVLGDPRLALTWLVNELSSLGIELAAGQVVTTGTCITPLPIAPGDRICADFGVFGEVRVVLAGADREAIADETRR
ncbi:MAG: hydratase [Vulcanimicrobiaceae bacterium]